MLYVIFKYMLLCCDLIPSWDSYVVVLANDTFTGMKILSESNFKHMLNAIKLISKEIILLRKIFDISKMQAASPLSQKCKAADQNKLQEMEQ